MSHALLHRTRSLATWIEHLSEWTGRATSWLVLGMVLLIAYDVAMRYLFHSGSVALQELEWHLFAVIFLIGAAYTLKHDDHVRVDVLYQSRWMNERRRAWVDLLGTLVFLVPFCLLIIISSWPFLSSSFLHGEGSPDPGGPALSLVTEGHHPAGFRSGAYSGDRDGHPCSAPYPRLGFGLGHFSDQAARYAQ